MPWSHYQEAIFNYVRNERGNLLIKAVAGSGKTTTLTAMQSLIGDEHIFLAFNNSIAAELRSRGLNAKTFHSACIPAVMKMLGKRGQEIDKDKTWKVFRSMYAASAAKMYYGFVSSIVGMAKNMGVGLPGYPELSEETFCDIVKMYGFRPSDKEAKVKYGIEMALETFRKSLTIADPDFDDILYYAAGFDAPLWRYPYVLGDEIQDTNSVQIGVLKKMLGSEGRFIGVGDENQSIYAFRGSNKDSMDLVREAFNCTVLPLSVTYRCPTSVVQYAQQWDPTIEAREGAPEGSVQFRDQNWNMYDIKVDDLVVCRTARPLIHMAFVMASHRIPVTIVGRDLGKGLISIIDETKSDTLHTLRDRITTMKRAEYDKFMADGNERRAEQSLDKYDAILITIDSSLKETSIDSLKSSISNLFRERSDAIRLCTVHQAKGLEADTVWWVDRSQCPSPWAWQPWELQQEDNICYVAATRAKKDLILIETMSESERDDAKERADMIRRIVAEKRSRGG